MDLGSLNLGDIESVISSLSPEDIKGLSAVAGELFSSGKSEKEKCEEKVRNEKDDFSFDNLFSGLDMKTLMKIMEIFKRLGEEKDDPRSTLILALKPLLSEDRRKKADEVVRILKLLSLLPYLKELS